MAEDVETIQGNPSNTCCAALKKKHTKLLEKYSKVEELKNQFRNCTEIIQKKYDVVEKENGSLKKALDDLKIQVNHWKDEKEKVSGRCVDLEDEVSALKDEVQLLKQNGNSASQAADKQIQEHLNMAQKEIRQLKELLDQEKGRAALAKKNAELEKKKAEEALRKVDTAKKNVSEAQKVTNVERKKAEENRLLWEKLKVELDSVKSMLASEKLKCADAEKKVEVEKQKVIRERKRADLAVAKSEEQLQLAKTNLNKAMIEKDQADDLRRQLEEAKNRVKKLEELHENSGTGKLVEAKADESRTGKITEFPSDVCMRMVKNDARLAKWMENIFLENEDNVIREKKRADSEKNEAKKQKKVAKAQKKIATEQKHRADQLSRELESYQLTLEELRKEVQEFVSHRKYADNAPLRNNDVIFESDTVKLLKKQLKLEKRLVKHAQKASEVEVIRNKMLHQEIFHLKQEFLWFQQRLDMLDKSFVHGGEGIHKLEKIGKRMSVRETLCSDVCNSQCISGIHSRLGPPCGGSSQKMLQSSAINSSSASFSDRPLVGSQERGSFSVTTAKNGEEDISNLKPTTSRLCDKMRVRRNEPDAATKAGMRSPIKDKANERKVGQSGRKRIPDADESIENFHSKGEKLHRRVSEKLSLLHGILNGQVDEPEKEDWKGNSCSKLVRPFKRRKKSCEGTLASYQLQDLEEPNSVLNSNTDHSDAYMHASPPGFHEMRSHRCLKDGPTNIIGDNQSIPQDFDKIAAHDYMKLLELDNADDENSFRIAISMPLSPTLPVVELHDDETLEVANPVMPVNKTSEKEFPIINEESVEFTKNSDSVLASDTHFQQICVSGANLGPSDVSGLQNNETNITCERGIVSAHGGPVKYFVVPSDNKESSGILKILQTTHTCMPRCSFLCQAEMFLRSILHRILKVEDLSMKEKVCVFFSLILHGVSEFGTGNLTNVLSDSFVHSLDSVTLNIHSAFSDPVLRRIFMESCDLFELFAVIEDFLLRRKVLVCGDVPAGSEAGLSSKSNLVLNGNPMSVSEVLASPELLLAGGSLFASLCSAVDHIGLVREMSCNIISMQKFDPAVMLALLHAFAHICGSKYFTLEQYPTAMTVVKSVVMFLEKQTPSTNSTSFSQLIFKFQLCRTNCPFSEGAVSMEDVALMLLENLRKHGQSHTLPQDLELVNSVVPVLRSHGERTEDVSGSRGSVPSRFSSDENLCNFIDVLSLVEILASFMGWEWTCDHIIGQICECVESQLVEGFSAATIVLLGQLGRLGVVARGYEDPGVTKLRKWLSAFVFKITFLKLSFSVQFAIITSILGLTPTKFEEIVEGKVETPSVNVPARFIREWFSQLSCEQQSNFWLHRSASESNLSPQTDIA